MKTILTFFTCLYANIVLAQSQATSPCDSRLLTQFDSVKGEYVSNIKDEIVIKKDEDNKLSLSLLAMEHTIVLSIAVVGGGDCIDETNKMNIVFRDGTRLEMLNNGGFNCDAEFSVFFGGDFGHKKELGLLLSREIESIKVTTRKSTIDKARNNVVEVPVSTETGKLIMESITCLTK
ncbi:MAG TPA: hypothetical protein VIM65_14290 [Cyclobacteriaceae bacterium]